MTKGAVRGALDHVRGRRLLAAVVLLSLLAGCQREEPRAGAPPSITIAVENDIQTLDPSLLSDPHTSRIVWQIFEGLVGLGANGRVLPLLAESWSASADFKRWTFKMRPGVMYHESDVFKTPRKTRSVTAADVVYSYRRFAKGFGSFVFAGLVEGFDAYVAGTAEDVRGFSAPDPQTFQVTLTRSDPAFLFRITSPYLGVMPREAVEAAPDAFGVSIAVGTGPFRLVERSTTQVTLDRNSSYWRGTAGNLGRVVFRVEKNPQFRVSQLERGGYDVIQLPFAFVPKYLSGGRLRAEFEDRLVLYVAQTFNVYYLGIDNRQVGEVSLRRAIAQAVDKQAIVDGLLYGLAVTASSPIPPGLQGFDPPRDLPFDRDSARREVERSRRPRRVLRLVASDVGSGEQVAQVIQGNLKDVGIETRIERVDFNTLISRVFSKDRPELFLAFSEWIYGAPELIMDVFDSRRFPNPNAFAYANRQIDAQLALLPTITDRGALNARIREIASAANNDAPAVWLYHQRSPYLLRRRVQGFAVNGHQHWQLADVRVGST